MKILPASSKSGFTLLETVIAIGVLAVMLTTFMIVFAPAASGIRKSINAQEADRLASTLESELVTLREGEKSANIATGFDKAYKMIQDSMKTASAEPILVYQYRGDPDSVRTDGTYAPYVDATEGIPGKDYVVVPMVRRRVQLNSDTEDEYLQADLSALVGRVYAVRAIQLVFTGSPAAMVRSTKQDIEDPTPGEDFDGTTPPISGDYPEAVIAFSADFYAVPSSAYSYLRKGGPFDVSKLKKPLFSRNLAVRR